MTVTRSGATRFEPDPAAPTELTRRHIRRPGPLVVGVTVTAAYAGIGLLVGIPAPIAIGLVILLVLGAPTSTLLSRRILINSAIALGWFPATWWLPFSFGSLGRTGAVTAVALGVTVTTSMILARLGRSLRPDVRAVDLLIPAAAAVALWFSAGWWAVRSPGEQLSRLLISGWDHAAHFSMIFLQRTFEMLPPGSTEFAGSPLLYSSYVQYTNSLVTGAAELWAGPCALGATDELLLYMPSTSAIYSWLLVMVIAGIVQLPRLRHRPGRLLVVVTMATTVYVLGPGGGGFSAGHLNIVYGGACIAALILLTAPRRDLFRPLIFVAGSGLILAASAGWSLLAPMAVTIGLATLLRLPRWRRGLRRHLITTVGCAVLLAAGFVIIVAITVDPSVGEALGNVGRVTGVRLEQTLAVATAALLLCGWPLARGRTRERRGSAQVWIVTIILAWVFAFAVFQVATYGSLAYYFWKLLQGAQVALVGSVAVGAARFGRVLPRPLTRRQQIWAAAALSMVVVSTAFFYGVPTAKLGARSPAIAACDASYDSADATSAGDRLLQAYDKASGYPPGTVTYYAVEAGDGLSPRNDAWLHALLGDWTTAVQDAREPATNLRRGGQSVHDDFYTDVATRIAETLEIGGPNHIVIVGPTAYDEIRSLLPADLRSRLVHY